MTVEISYFENLATGHLPVAADPGQDGTTLEAQSVSITSSPTLSASTPDAAKAMCITGTEAFRYEYSRAGSVGVVANSNYVPAGIPMWLAPRADYKFSLRTA